MLKSSLAPILSIIPMKPPKYPVACLSLFRPSAVRDNVSANAVEPPPQSYPTSAYIHLPFCRKRCHYCDFPIVALGSSSANLPDDIDDPRILNYVQLLCREIEATKVLKSDNHSPLKTVFFGGGTPSLVPPRLVSKILETLNLKFGVNSNAEISIEMDPGTFDAQKLSDLLNLGVNRVSLGVQAFQEELLKACGRAHSLKQVYEAIEIIGSCGASNWSLDLISSLPHQTSEMWKESLERAIKAEPTHVSVYDLQVEKGTKFGLLYKPGEFPLPDDTLSAEFYKMASKTLCNTGYNHYEISSYCKKGYECQHNLTYWKNGYYYAFGLGSASHLDGVRFSRPRKMKEYTSYVQNLEDGALIQHENGQKDAKDLEMDVVMLSLRTSKGLDLTSFRECFGSGLVLSLCKTFRPYIESGHVLLLDDKRRVLVEEEFWSVLSNESKIEEEVAFIRLSDPDGFLLSNELISIAFGCISP
ncbi:hypothetical protein C5167_026390 [Papaver somniferum]|uniref:uncharacterized protein LOC113326104 n=1 Tax=Papaver somniferum TaxID=3469 RepID=UPI000E6FD525|nr:uncharacterized protein LOC113326104 [Papaver somniferum]RZC85720.1 hypothetical protein C5167_026390 [Papaver somniferum]